MEKRTETRKPRGENHRLNVIQIPLLRAAGCAILCVYVFLYDLLAAPPFFWSRYLAFVAVLAAYCTGSWLALRSWYGRIKGFDLGLFFLITDLLFWILVIYRTGADKSLLFFLSVVRVSDQAFTTFRRVLIFAHLA